MDRSKTLGLFLTLVLNLTLVAPQSCTERTSCGECILLLHCLWCSDSELLGPHCVSRDSNFTCSDIQDPHGNITRVVDALQDTNATQQTTPVEISLELRVGEPLTFMVEVTPSADYPLDLYFLMDLSNSMQNDLDTIRLLAGELATTLGNITANFRIGFGSYTEKPLLPFATTSLQATQRTDYSFRHVVSLTDNVTLFRDLLASIEVNSNVDDPEALFDGMMQVVVCGEVVGWRREARRLLLILTDDSYHLAGDGRLAGIVRPHDGNCYVPAPMGMEPVDYQMWGVFDYPSIGQIRAKLREFDIIPIFAAVEEVAPAYRALVNEIEGAVFETLTEDSNNFLRIIETSYNATAQRVELLPSSSSAVEFVITARCGSAVETGEGVCEGVDVGQTARFDVQVTLTSCVEEVERLDIRVPGFGRVEIEISGICHCPCENETEFNSTLCSENGHYSCGACQCFEGQFGSDCACRSEAAVAQTCPSGEEVREECSGRGSCSCGQCVCDPEWYGRACECDNEDTAFLDCPVGVGANRACSGRGSCLCGQCTCNPPSITMTTLGVENPRYYGVACECDNFTCDMNTAGFVCSGRGECECNHTCTCMASPVSGRPYTGTACECPPIEEACIGTGSTVMCSGRGRCSCDHCVCDVEFFGAFCENSRADAILECGGDGERCVRCEKGLLRGNCDNCSVILVDPVTSPDYEINENLAIPCSFKDGDGCVHIYYTIGAEGPIHAENTRSCGRALFPLWAAVVIALTGALLLGGCMVLVAIKIIIIVLDRREVKKFQAETRRSQFTVEENPLYRGPGQKFENVAYGTDAFQ